MEPIYVMKVEKKGRATETMFDRYDHTIILSELFVKENYLKLTRSKKLNKKQLTIIDYDVMITPDEVFEAFLENDNDQSIYPQMRMQLLWKNSNENIAFRCIDIFITVFTFLSFPWTLKLLVVLIILNSSKNCSEIWYTIFDNNLQYYF